jgi:hypothetical protein
LGSRLIACWVSTALDPPPLFALESPPLLALGSRPIACRVSDPLDRPPLFASESRLFACWESTVLDPPPLFALEPPPLIASESRLLACWESTVLDPPPLFALEPPPLIASESRLIASEVSDVVWIVSGDSSRISSTKSSCSIATSCAIQASTSSSESYGESYIVTSVGGGLPLPECLDGPLPTLVSVKAAKVRIVEARVDDRHPTRAVASLDPSTAGGAAGPPNPVVTPVEVLSAGGGSRSTAPEALRDCPPLFALDPPPLIALEPRLFAHGVSTALVVLS